MKFHHVLTGFTLLVPSAAVGDTVNEWGAGTSRFLDKTTKGGEWGIDDEVVATVGDTVAEWGIDDEVVAPGTRPDRASGQIQHLPRSFQTIFARKLTPHTNQSDQVVIIGGATLNTTLPCLSGALSNANRIVGGGCLPLSGGELGDFTFAAMHPSAVDASSLAAYDTAVLNVASFAMACDTGNLSDQAKDDLVAFVAAGNKLIIYHSECATIDYMWLPYPFMTNNPGAPGARGTLTIVEDNTLSHDDPNDTHYINAAFLGSSTDAVGDMNVMTTFDPNWCVDMSGTNANGFTRPVHTYATTTIGSNKGMYIYNGLDIGFLNGGTTTASVELLTIWVQELQQPFNPSNLPCGVTVVGITLAPESDGATATLKDLLAIPVPDVQVNFSIISGPNMGASGMCSVNTDCTTDANGQVSFTYAGSTPTDVITATYANANGDTLTSQPVQPVPPPAPAGGGIQG
jgi:hypothetical protein